jgi:Uma2 family endonuclease
MTKKADAMESRVTLPDVSWQQFEKLLVEMGQNREVRMTYHRGQLELMTPQDEHVRYHRLVESAILLLADEAGLEIEAIAPILLKHSDLQLGAEADAGYYLHYRHRVNGKTELDLTHDPVPDLLVEVTMTASSLNKLSIYAGLGVPELWRYIVQDASDPQSSELLMYQLQGDRYCQSTYSTLFPFLPATTVLTFIQHSDSFGLVRAIEILRQWFREQQ